MDIGSIPRGLKADFDFVPGLGKIISDVNRIIADVAGTDMPILLSGESGTGKDTYARLVHCSSGLDMMPIRKITCTRGETKALIEEIHSALTQERPGTVFLDCVDELEPACQRTLLSLLPDGEPQSNETTGRARLISSSSEGLERLVAQGQFRRELYFRINAVSLGLPPLRERREDIPALFEGLLSRYSRMLQRPAPAIDSKAFDVLVLYDWPGNIRELANVAKKITACGDADAALVDLKRDSRVCCLGMVKTSSSLKLASRAASNRAERELILKALADTQWNRKRAARELQISYKSLLYKIKELVVEKSDREQL